MYMKTIHKFNTDCSKYLNAKAEAPCLSTCTFKRALVKYREVAQKCIS